MKTNKLYSLVVNQKKTTTRNVTLVPNNNQEPYPYEFLVADGQPIYQPAAPFKSDYSFKRWSKDVQGANAWDFLLDKVTQDINLYAQFEPQGEATFVRPGTYDWVVPENVDEIAFIVIGGGGGGLLGFFSTETTSGGSGASAIGRLKAVPGSVLTITVGGRGEGATIIGDRFSGSAGGTSSIKLGGTNIATCNGGGSGDKLVNSRWVGSGGTRTIASDAELLAIGMDRISLSSSAGVDGVVADSASCTSPATTNSRGDDVYGTNYSYLQQAFPTLTGSGIGFGYGGGGRRNNQPNGSCNASLGQPGNRGFVRIIYGKSAEFIDTNTQPTIMTPETNSDKFKGVKFSKSATNTIRVDYPETSSIGDRIIIYVTSTSTVQEPDGWEQFVGIPPAFREIGLTKLRGSEQYVDITLSSSATTLATAVAFPSEYSILLNPVIAINYNGVSFLNSAIDPIYLESKEDIYLEFMQLTDNSGTVDRTYSMILNGNWSGNFQNFDNSNPSLISFQAFAYCKLPHGSGTTHLGTGYQYTNPNTVDNRRSGLKLILTKPFGV